MRLSLKAKLTALITALVLLVVVVTSTVYISNLTRQALLEVQAKGEYVESEVYHQAHAVLAESRMPEGQDPQDFQSLRSFIQLRLSSDAGLASLMIALVFLQWLGALLVFGGQLNQAIARARPR